MCWIYFGVLLDDDFNHFKNIHNNVKIVGYPYQKKPNACMGDLLEKS